MRQKPPTYVWIDRGSKYIWLAYMRGAESMPMPIWYIENDANLYYSLSDIFARYKANVIIIGYPRTQEDIQKKINTFIDKISLIIPEKVTIEKVNEDYTTVQAWDILSNFKKNAATDTVSAMMILEQRQKEQK